MSSTIRRVTDPDMSAAPKPPADVAPMGEDDTSPERVDEPWQRSIVNGFDKPKQRALTGTILLAGLLTLCLLPSVQSQDHTDSAPLSMLALSIPIILGSLGWLLGDGDPEVSKIIRRELLASFAGFLTGRLMMSIAIPSVQHTIQNGMLSLLTAAMVISSFRVFFEGIAVASHRWAEPWKDPVMPMLQATTQLASDEQEPTASM